MTTARLSPLIYLLCMLCWYGLRAQPVFDCNGKLLLSQYNGGQPTFLNEIEVLGGVAIFQQINSHPVLYNSSGYNRQDNLIYGFEPGSKTVYRLFADNTFLNMGTLGSLPGGLFAGDVDSAGVYLLTGNNGSIFFIDISGTTANIISSVPLYYNNSQYTGTPGFIDIAFHPQTQRLWGYDNNIDRIVEVDAQTGEVFPIGIPQPGYALGALFFNSFGDLYGYDANTLYRIDQVTGQITQVAVGPSGSGRDGCSCPYTVQISKASSAAAVCPGDTLTFVVRISNLTGVTMPGVTLIDELPPGATIISGPTPLIGTVAPGTGVGTSNLVLQNMTLQMQANVFSYQVAVDSPFVGSNLTSQAKLTDLLVVSADTLFSDDPNSGPIGDPTKVVVYPTRVHRKAILTNNAYCPGDTLVLVAQTTQPALFRWTDEQDSLLSTGQNLFIPGMYVNTDRWIYLEILENNCTRVFDSIRIQTVPCNERFPCYNEFLLSHGNSNTTVGELQYNTTFALSNPRQIQLTTNALGYHPKDKLLYGISPQSNQLVRWYANGNMTALPLPAGMPIQNVEYPSGDIDSSGSFTVTTNTGLIAQLKVDQPAPSLLGIQPLRYTNGSGTPYFGDIAFHPITNQLYGFDTVTRKMAIIDPITGTVDTFGPATPVHQQIDALFFNGFGRLYGYGTDTLFRVLPDSGAIFALTTGNVSGVLDGCVCPDGLAIEKIILPGSQGCKGDTFTYAITIRNNTGFPQSVFRIQDNLDPRLVITQVTHSLPGITPGGTGVGTSRFSLFNTTIPTGLSSITVKVTTRSSFLTASVVSNQVFLIPNLKTLGDTIWSDNPSTGYILDNTQLSIGLPTQSNLSFTGCAPDTFVVAGQVFTQSGQYQILLQNTSGCDSLITVDVTLFPSFKDTVAASICAGGRYFAAGQWQTQPGTYIDNFTSVHGCDSTIVTQLQVSPFVSTNLQSAICQGESVLFGGQLISQAGVYRDTLLSYLGCDSIITLQLTISTSITSFDTIQICTGDSVFVGGTWQNSSGTYIDSLIAQSGCDSLITTTLFVTAQVSGQQQVAICNGDSLWVSGQWQKTAGVYRDTLLSAAGCDSIHATILQILPVFSDTLSVTLCTGDSLWVGGNWQKSDGWYVDSYLSTQGCDSTVTTHLLFLASFNTQVADTICYGESYQVGSQLYTQSGQYTVTLTTAQGCDSTIQLNLLVTPLPTPAMGTDTTICQGDTVILDAGNYSTYQWSTGNIARTQVVTSTGQYWVVVTDPYGCRNQDSITIEVEPLPVFSLGKDTVLCPGFSLTVIGDAGGWPVTWSTGDMGDSLTINAPGLYVATSKSTNCAFSDSIKVDTFPLPWLDMPSDTLICLSDVWQIDVTQAWAVNYSWQHGPNTPAITLIDSGEYVVAFTDLNGCVQLDSLLLRKEYCRPAIHMPTGFSPNGDGINDVLLYQIVDAEVLSVKVFNRWGQMVFDDIGSYWDGTIDGQPAPMDTYVVIITYLDDEGNAMSYRSNLTLLR